MSYRDATFFRAIGAISLRIELLFFSACWPRVLLPIFEISRFVVLLVMAVSMIFVYSPVLSQINSLEMSAGAMAILLYLSAPVCSPIFCFLRPTIKQFPSRKYDLRLVCWFSERIKFTGMALYSLLFIGQIIDAGRHLGVRGALLHFAIIAPFFVLAFKQCKKHYGLIARARMLAKRCAKKCPAETISVGSWSEKFVEGYRIDLCFFLAILFCDVLIQ